MSHDLPDTSVQTVNRWRRHNRTYASPSQRGEERRGGEVRKPFMEHLDSPPMTEWEITKVSGEDNRGRSHRCLPAYLGL